MEKACARIYFDSDNRRQLFDRLLKIISITNIRGTLKYTWWWSAKRTLNFYSRQTHRKIHRQKTIRAMSNLINVESLWNFNTAYTRTASSRPSYGWLNVNTTDFCDTSRRIKCNFFIESSYYYLSFYWHIECYVLFTIRISREHFQLNIWRENADIQK